MIKISIDEQQQKIDYSEYEKLLQKITSVQLEEIKSLQPSEQLQFNESWKNVSESYYKKIEDLLQGLDEEV